MSTYTKGGFVPQYSRTFKREVAKASRPVVPASGTGNCAATASPLRTHSTNPRARL